MAFDVTDDSRDTRAGSLFVAVRGEKFDGHQFVLPAIRAGAGAVVLERDMAVPGTCIKVVVSDTRMALARLSAVFYGLRGTRRVPLRLIGVTGTNGKTTTAWLLRSILRAAGEPAALLGTVEYDLISERFEAPQTTPGPVTLARHLAAANQAGGRYAVLEVSSHALDQKRCDGLAFGAAVFTNLSGDHLDYHHSMDAYAAAKRRLFELLDRDGVAVINLDDETGRAFARELPRRVVTYALHERRADVVADVEALHAGGSRFTLQGRGWKGDGNPVEWPLIGEHNLYNALAAAATAEAIGVPNAAILEGLRKVEGVPGRLQRVEPPGFPFSVFVDYAHTDAALVHVLSALRPMTHGRLICVFGCGGDRDRSKRPRMGQAVSRFADIAFVTSDNPRGEEPTRIMEEILLGMADQRRCRVRVEVDRRQAIGAALEEALRGDVVLIAGKGHEKYQEVGGVKHPFDDVTIARECLEACPSVRESL